MGFFQTIDVAASDEQALVDHLASWHSNQAGVAPGYQSAHLLADVDRPGRYLIQVEFASAEGKDQNNERAETAAWAATLGTLISGEPTYRNFRPVYATESAAPTLT